MSECKAYRRELGGAAEGGRVSAGARAHASSCRACGDELREHESLRALVGGLARVEAPADFEFRLRARMAGAKGGGGRGRFAGRWLYGFAPVAVAACFVVVSATLYFRQAARPGAADAPAVAAEPARNAEPARATPAINVQGGPAGPAVKQKQEEVASARVHKSVRGLSAHARRPRAAAASGGERGADGAQRTAVNSFVTARVLRPVQPVTIALKAPGEPLRMIVRDERGAERVVPVRAVSFGSQDFIAREAAVKQPGAAHVGGVW